MKLDIAFSIDEIGVDHHIGFATTGSNGQITILSEKVTALEDDATTICVYESATTKDIRETP